MAVKFDAATPGSVPIPANNIPTAQDEEIKALRKSVQDAYNSYLHPEPEPVHHDKLPLNQRTQDFEGYAEENMIYISMSNESSTIKIKTTFKSML